MLCFLLLGAARAEAAALEVVFPAGQGSVRVADTRLCAQTCTREVAPGTPVTLRAAAEDEYVFAGWDDPAHCAEGTGAVCTVTVPEAGLRLNALFEVAPTDALSVDLIGPGRIESQAGWRCSSDEQRCRVAVTPGAPVRIAVDPAPGRSVAYWSVWECQAPQTACTITADQRQTVSVYLTPVTVTVARSGPGAVALGPPFAACGLACRRIERTFAWGSNATVRVTSGAAAFLGWDSGACGRRPACTFAVREPTRLNATFARSSKRARRRRHGRRRRRRRRRPAPGQPAFGGKNITLRVDGPGKVYIASQRRFCRSGKTCTVATSVSVQGQAPRRRAVRRMAFDDLPATAEPVRVHGRLCRQRPRGLPAMSTRTHPEPKDQRPPPWQRLSGVVKAIVGVVTGLAATVAAALALVNATGRETPTPPSRQVDAGDREACRRGTHDAGDLGRPEPG